MFLKYRLYMHSTTTTSLWTSVRPRGGFQEADQWLHQTAEVQIANDTQPPTPHIGFNLHTRHIDYDSTVACLALHSLEHMQLHLLFCSNHYCIELHSKTLTVYITVSQYIRSIHTSISLLRIRITMCIFWKCVYSIVCTIFLLCKYLYCVYCCLCTFSYLAACTAMALVPKSCT